MKKIIYLTIALFFAITSNCYADIIVGTTGDYAPFSIYDKNDNKFSGKDIDLIKTFAKANNEDIKFVKTTWATAEGDLKDSKFDVFVGGMTITPTRQTKFIFSTPLGSFSKAAMTNCKNLSKFKSFADIDNPNTLIIENRGGTNENFALQKIKNAQLLIIADNKLAVKSITDGIDGIYPDIMFTDSPEIAYQHSINPNICQVPIKVDDSISYKAFMFNNTPIGKNLANKFNDWIKDNPKIFHQYLNSEK
ncbi:transporter substrate-binding domain-containing protein [Francisella philomiragia]|uniref:transporter substrate-binding domain-containing protein n=1 Tax=Francisella philomiragia TaxID=28110 RepID=UPI0005A573DC|nr:transporter substrate-binding domain-containing protein [Francisella philomiragia]AJI56749.1 bacterial extracellular solute-binding s, 3 family protein [Francisella philomiragia]MBK2025313.1 transporter substrate-binding domain-containing protein [Francisella philomiragia]